MYDAVGKMLAEILQNIAKYDSRNSAVFNILAIQFDAIGDKNKVESASDGFHLGFYRQSTIRLCQQTLSIKRKFNADIVNCQCQFVSNF